MQLRTSVVGAAQLAATGALSALCLFVLSAHRVESLPGAVVTPFLLLLQYHAFGWSLGKLGLDYAIFTVVSRDPGKAFIGRGLVTPPMAIALAAFAVVATALLGWAAGAVVCVAVVADVASSMIMADLAARNHFRAIAVGGLLNLPLFFVLWVVAAAFSTPSALQGVALFALTSILRLVWLTACYRRRQRAFPLPVSRLRSPVQIAMQGVLNFALFRLDQLALATFYFAGAGLVEHRGEIGQYLFLGRVIDIANGVFGIVTQTFLPKRYIEYASHGPRDWRTVGAWSAVAACLWGVGAAAYFVVAGFFDGPPIPRSLLLAFSLQIPLILLANLITYSIQRSERLAGLLRKEASALLPGIALIVAAAANGSLLLLALVPVIQLATFIALGLFAPAGEPAAMARANAR